MAAKSVDDILSKATAAGMTDPKHLVAFALGFASGEKAAKTPKASKPKFFYWPIAGRAELIRLVAVVGGVELEESADIPKDKSAYGSKSGVPLLEDGALKMSQSLAIERYIADIAPKFSGLTPQQRAIDGMFAATKEDMIQGVAKILFSPDKSNAATDVPKVFNAFLPILEGLVPATGFVNGLEFPTMADLAILNIVEGYMPFGAGLKLAGDAGGAKLYAAYPKVAALAKRTAAADGVKEYLATSKSMGGAPKGF